WDVFKQAAAQYLRQVVAAYRVVGGGKASEHVLQRPQHACTGHIVCLILRGEEGGNDAGARNRSDGLRKYLEEVFERPQVLVVGIDRLTAVDDRFIYQDQRSLSLGLGCFQQFAQ